MTTEPLFYLPKSALKHGKILDVNIVSTSKGQVLRFFRSRITAREKFYMVTPNPEIILAAQKDLKLKKILNSAAVSLPDGIGLAQAAKFLSFSTPRNPLIRVVVLFFQGLLVGLATFFNRDWLTSTLKPVPGRAIFMQLMGLANQKGWRVFFLGDRTVGKAKERLTANLKSVKVEAMEGPWLDDKANPKTEEEKAKEANCIARINEFKPQILFVGFNAPKQEKWVYKWYKRLDIGSAMVVGGTFDYFAGKATLPPKWMEQAWLEWLWRLIRQPWRIGRIINAVIVFPIKVCLSKLGQRK